MNANATAAVRRLFLVLGDQLDPEAGWLADFDPQADALWMAEVAEESTHVWSHLARIALFLSAMRHFRDAARGRGWTVHYHELDAGQPSLAAALATDLARLRPQRVLGCWPGDWRVKQALAAACAEAGHGIDWRQDGHFLVAPAQFERWAGDRRSFTMEHFYRRQRQRLGVLMDHDGQPLGGRWNFDADNRHAFGREGPGLLPAPRAFPPDPLTRQVIEQVRARFPGHPGSLDRFDWPVTPTQARQALDDFIAHRLPAFGPFQDALWSGQPWLYHSRLAAAMNLKLLDPRTVIAAAEQALLDGRAPLASVEGFVRQVLGWREYVRGLYWLRMPQFAEENALEARAPLPALYWSGATDMACMADAIGQTLQHGYAHHIQRLMVTGLFALLLGVRPQQVHAWYLAVYVDAVEWVELPNTLGMSQYADGGVLASKPYVASGKYIQRMGNHCAGCRFDPALATGARACPFTTLYWDFLARHRERFARHPRTALQWKSLDRLDAGQREQIATQADALRTHLA
jgi:deoxyribodipyrimidine photolyase-related protein